MTHLLKRIVFASLLAGALSATHAQSLSQVKTGAEADLEAALVELAELRAEIRAEKIPLAQERRALESEVRLLREEAEAARAVQDNADLRLDQLRAQISGREEEIQYVSNLLDEYIRGLQSRIHVSQVESIEPRLTKILDEAESPIDDSLSVTTLAEGIAVGMERLKEVTGGALFEGKAVLPNGDFGTGTFVLAGPVAYFASGDEGGLVERGESLRPSVVPVSQGDVALAIAELKNSGSASFPVDATLGNARAIEQTEATFFEHIGKGGVWIFPILGFAVLSMAIGAFKAVELYSIKTNSDATVSELLHLVKSGKREEALKKAADLKGPSGEMLRIGIRHSKDSIPLVEELLIEKVIEAQPKTHRLLAFISTTAAVSPLLGLLGTVTGMINTFQLITIFGTGDARNLSSGISEALITTEFGLIVAIPSLILHAVLSRKANSILASMEKQAISFINGLKIAREAT
jgi:biopolymer transport protein ExbB